MQRVRPKDQPRVLIVDDEQGLRLMLKAVLTEKDWLVQEAANGEQALDQVLAQEPDLILLDMRMPGLSGIEVLRRLQATHRHIPVVMLTAYATVDFAVEAMKIGAFDFLTKPADNEEILAVLDRALEYSRYLGQEGPESRSPKGGDQLIGQGQAMQQVKDFIRQAGPSQATVLIQGESGTGKELVAQALHQASQRASGALIKVNCAALPENLLESELFGYCKGAFTGALKDKPGRFLLADKGTLFLDEVAELDLSLQAKLLRVLQERVVEPLGALRPQGIDVRVIAATNQDLDQAIAAGDFRKDLYYRLNVLEIQIPPLRERLEDLPDLTGHLLAKLAEKNQRRAPTASSRLLAQLKAYSWPGNVRELENVLERALVLSSSRRLGPEDLPPQITQAKTDTRTGTQTDQDPVRSMQEAERQAIVSALKANDQHRGRTAQSLGISRRTLQYKLRKHKLTGR